MHEFTQITSKKYSAQTPPLLGRGTPSPQTLHIYKVDVTAATAIDVIDIIVTENQVRIISILVCHYKFRAVG